MKCERCGKDEAVIKLTRIDAGQVSSVLLCQACAAEQSPFQKKMLKTPSIDHLLKELLKTQQKAGAVLEVLGAEASTIAVEPCLTCGLEFALYKATYMLGCPACYEAFEEHLEDDLVKMHKATRHVGESPAGNDDLVAQQRRVEVAREELKAALDLEDFERAAFLRDEIRRLEKQLGEGKKD